MPQKILIIGAGGSVRDNLWSIKKFIKKHKITTIGINNMTGMVIPDYHLWTNKKRFTEFHNSIKTESKLLLGSGIPPKLIRRYYKGNYEIINFKDKKWHTLKITKDSIKGRFRTAGTLAIAVAYSWNPSIEIFVVGMDGYTLYPSKRLKGKSENQHCYGAGFTDDSTWKECSIKDDLVYEVLRSLKEYGVNFRIITPTKFSDFYDQSVLGIQTARL